MILIAGATGTLGSEICRLLAEKRKEIRALVRATSDADKVGNLERLGAEIVRGDLKDRSSLDAACSGATMVISTVSSTHARQEGDNIESVDNQGQINLIQAAATAGVGHFILISFPEMDGSFPLQDAKRAAEVAIKKSGMSFTILQPTFFTEVWFSPALGFDAANGQARIYGSGEKKTSWISYRDVARFVAAAVDDPAARNAVIQLGGPEALSPLEVVSIFERVSGKSFDVQKVPVEALNAQKESAADSLSKSFASLMLANAAGNPIDMTETLQQFPIELSSVEEYARSVVGG
jgi:uncharacterized protein YbjT (DUF2867 family)